MGVEEILMQFQDYFCIDSIFIKILFMFGIGVMLLMYWFASSSENLLTDISKFLDFTTYQGMQEIIDYVIPIAIIFMTIAFVFIGILLIFGNEKIKISSVFQNMLIAFLIVAIIPIAMTLLTQLTKSGSEYVKGGMEEGFAFQVVKNNVYDLLYLDGMGYSSDFVNQKNALTPEIFDRLGFWAWGESINTDNDDLYTLNNPEVFEKKLVLNANGVYELKDLDQKMLTIFKEYYMRWHVNFGTIYANLAVIIFVIVLTSLKMARIIYEIAVNQVILVLVSFSDIATGQRVKKVIPDIISGFVAIGVFFLLIRIYIVASAYVTTLDISELAKIIIQIAIAFAVVDGPNMIEKILGIDAGLKDAWRTAMGAYATGKALASAPGNVKKGYNAVKNLAKYGSQKVNSLAEDVQAKRDKYAPGIKQAAGKAMGMNVPLSLEQQRRSQEAFMQDKGMQKYSMHVNRTARQKEETTYAKTRAAEIERMASGTTTMPETKAVEQATSGVTNATTSEMAQTGKDLATGRISNLDSQKTATASQIASFEQQSDQTTSAMSSTAMTTATDLAASTITSLEQQGNSNVSMQADLTQQGTANKLSDGQAQAVKKDVQTLEHQTSTLSSGGSGSSQPSQTDGGHVVNNGARDGNLRNSSYHAIANSTSVSDGGSTSIRTTPTSGVQSSGSSGIGGATQGSSKAPQKLESQVNVGKNENVTVGGHISSSVHSTVTMNVNSNSTSAVNSNANAVTTATKQVDSVFKEPTITRPSERTVSSGSGESGVSAPSSEESHKVEIRNNMVNSSPNSLQQDVQRANATIRQELEPNFKPLTDQSSTTVREKQVKEVQEISNTVKNDVVNRVKTEQLHQTTQQTKEQVNRYTNNITKQTTEELFQEIKTRQSKTSEQMLKEINDKFKK